MITEHLKFFSVSTEVMSGCQKESCALARPSGKANTSKIINIVQKEKHIL